MEIDLTRLKSNLDEYIDIDLTYSFDKSILECTELISLDNVKIKGEITKNSLNDFVINVKVDGTMVLPCAITLEPVDYPFSFEINDEVDKLLKEIDENHTKYENTLDIFPIIWENILIEIPARVVKKDADTSKLKGDGWEFVTGERKSINPELEKLKDLL